MTIQGWFPLGLTGLISLKSKGLSRVFSSTTIWKHQFFGAQPSFTLSFPDGSDGKEYACNVGDQVRSLGREDPLEKGMAIHSSILAWRIPWTEEPGGLKSIGLQRVEHGWAFMKANTFTFSLLYGPTLTSIHDCWKNCGFDYTDHCSNLGSLYWEPVLATGPPGKSLRVYFLDSYFVLWTLSET